MLLKVEKSREMYVTHTLSLHYFYTHIPTPVSYTHLDVYKRQFLLRLEMEQLFRIDTPLVKPSLLCFQSFRS